MPRWFPARAAVCAVCIALTAIDTPLAQRDEAARARTLLAQGKEELAAGRYAEAVKMLSAAAELNRSLDNAVGEAHVLIQLGAAYRRLGRNPDGLIANQQALAACSKAADRTCEAEARYQVGTFHFYLGKYPDALDQYQQSLSLWQSLGNVGQQGLLLSEMGWLYWISGESDKAIDHFLRSLPLSAAAGDKSTEGYARNNLGLAYSFLGDAEASQRYFEEALELRRSAGEAAGEAQTLGNICSLHWRLGEYQQSLDICGKALSLARSARDRNTEAWVLDTMGLSFWSFGDSARALEHHRDALALRRALDDRQGTPQTLNNIGWAHLSLGQRTEARSHFDEALAASRAVANPRIESLVLNNLGLSAFYAADYELALVQLEASLRLRRGGGDRRGEGQSLHNLGRVHAARGNHAAADEHYRQARDLFKSIGDRSNEANTLLALAEHVADRGDLGTARSIADEALTLAESLRTKIASQDLRASYLAARQNYYDLSIDVLMRLHREDPRAGYAGQALHVSERARARSLLEALAEAQADLTRGVDPALLERERTARRRLDARERSRIELLNRTHTPAQAAAAERELESVLQEYRDVRTQVRISSPRYAAVTQPQPLTLKEIQARLLDDRSVLLEYRLGEERSYLWTVTRTAVRGYALPGRTQIERASRRFYDLLIESRQRLARAETERAASELSAMLLGPAAREIRERRVVIVADGILHYIPFAALADPSGGCTPAARFCPMIAGHEIVNLPSASVLDVIRRETRGRARATKMLAVFSDPVFSAADPRLGAAGRSGSPIPFERLPYSRREAESIAALADSARTLNALDFEASRAAAARPELADYRFVHFATHGIVDSVRPELSGLVLSLVDRKGAPQDGFLRVHELYNLNLGADLVVLSACRTALGREIKGEGMVGLARGFMYAGSPRVVASLWDVRDQATAELMTSFYRGMLAEKLAPAAALRAAQIDMWRNGRFEAPFYWAAFVLQGEWQ